MDDTVIDSAAIFEADLGNGVSLWDVSHVLPRHPTKKYKDRPDGAEIDTVVTHHSGAFNGPGVTGLIGMSRWVSNGPWSGHRYTGPASGRDWPGCPYHYYLSHERIKDDKGRVVILRAQHDRKILNHTGGLNVRGLGVCWEGNLSHGHEPADHQYHAAESLYAWLNRDIDKSRYTMHSEAAVFGGRPKPSCPGPYVTKWLKSWRGW